MSNPPIDINALCQVGIVVHDVKAVAAKYAEALGLPMPEIVTTPGHDKAKTLVHGAPSEAITQLAFFQTGQIVIELIQPDHQPSVWREHLDTRGESVHHIAFNVTGSRDIHKSLAADGIPVLQEGLYFDGSGMYSYVDTVPQLGVVVELLESFAKPVSA